MNLKIRIKKPSRSNFVWALIFLAFLKPGYFGTIASLDNALDVIRILTVLGLTGYYVLIKKSVVKYSIYVLIYSFIPLFASVLYGGDIFSAFTLCAVAFGTSMVINNVSMENQEVVFSSLYSVLEILIYLNLITIYMFPHGLYLFEQSSGWISDQAWILGLRNAQTSYLMLGCIVASMYYLLEANTFWKKIRVVLLFIAIFITINTLKIGSGYISFFVFLFLLILCFLNKKIIISFNGVLIGHVILFLVMTLLGGSDFFSYIFSFVGALVGRTETIFARVNIWSATWLKIWESPLWGYGMQDTNQLLWLSTVAAGASTTHNTFLDIIYRGGWLSFFFFMIVLKDISLRVNNLRKTNLLLYNLSSISLLSFFIIAQAEGAMTGSTMYIMLGLLWAIPLLSKQGE